MIPIKFLYCSAFVLSKGANLLPFQSQLFLIILFLRKININTLEIQRNVWSSFFVYLSIIIKILILAIGKALIPDEQ